MKVRGTPSKSAAVSILVAAALIVTALVAVIGSAQAAPQKKIYDATVRVTPATTPAETSATLRLTLTNNNQSTQTLGSANFTAPTGVTVQSVVVQPPPPVAPNSTTNRAGWTAAKNANGTIVEFRSTSNALPKNSSVFADVVIAISTTAPTCGNATWTAAAKQSNDFSGTGNDFTIGTSTNLRPLGSLAFVNPTVPTDPPIGTHVDNPATTNVEQLFVPQIAIPDPAAAVKVAAKDVCGVPYPKYGRSTTFGAQATLSKADSATLTNAVIPAITWSDAISGSTVGTGSTSVDPATGQIETGDQLVLDDDSTAIAATSNEFDVVEKICTVFDTTCHWDNGNNKIHVDAAPPSGGASLGIGFIDDDGFSCGGSSSALGQTLIYANPRDYGANTGQSVTYTYDKSVPGTSGNLANFDFCFSKEGPDGPWTLMSDCPTSPPLIADAPCVQDLGRVQGNLVVTLFFDPHADPLHGGR
jgi:hypothetical protein